MQQIYSAFFRELKDFYTFEEIAQNFGLSLTEDVKAKKSEDSSENKYKSNKESLKKVLDKLCNKRICKYGKPKELRTDDINDDEADDFIISETEFDNKKNKNENYYNFGFVGIVSYENFIFYVYPKYIQYKKNPNEKLLRPLSEESCEEYNDAIKNIDNSFRTVMKVINVFAKDNFIQPLTFINNPTKHIDPVSFMVFMLHHYYEYGLYYKEEVVIETNGDGEIDWEKTVNETVPIIQNNVPYYVELKTIQKQEASINLLRNLHMAILSECSKKLEEMGILKYLGIAPLYFEYRSVENLGSVDYLERIIMNELRIQNANLQKIQLYNMLHYLKENQESTHSKTINIYGTRKFDVVWEKVLKALFDDLYDNDRHYFYKGLKGKKPSVAEIEKELNLTLLPSDNSDKSKKTMQNYMGKTSMITGESKEPKKLNGGYSLKPDIVSIWKKKLLILDAKYYCVNEKEYDNELSITEVPVATDISKQFEYEKLFRQGLQAFSQNGKETSFEYVNMFLMPMMISQSELNSKNLFKKDYLADYQDLRKSFDMSNNNLIRIISLNPDICFEKFLQKESLLKDIDVNDMSDVFDDPEFDENYIKILVCFEKESNFRQNHIIESSNYLYGYMQCKKIIFIEGDLRDELYTLSKIEKIFDLAYVVNLSKNNEKYRFSFEISNEVENNSLTVDELRYALDNYKINKYVDSVNPRMCLIHKKFFMK